MCHTTIFPTPLWGRGVLGAVNKNLSLHSDKLSLGYFPALQPGECMPAGVCACVLPYRGVPLCPLSVCFWMDGWERGCRRPLPLFLTDESLPFFCFFCQTGLSFSPLLQLSMIYLPILTETSFPFSIFPHTRTDNAIMVVFFNLQPIKHVFLLTTFLEPHIGIVFFTFVYMNKLYIKNYSLKVLFNFYDTLSWISHD